MIRKPADRWKLGVFVAITVAFGSLILWKHLTPHTASSPDAAPIVLDPEHGACSTERLQLVCDRGVAAGWPSCTLAPGGVQVVQGVIPAGMVGVDSSWDDKHGAIGYDDEGLRYVVLSPDATCRDDDPALEHEVLCHLDYQIGHLNHAGSVCSADLARVSMLIPIRKEAP